MRKLRLLLAAALMSSAFVVVGAAPASASCVGEPNVCEIACRIGLGNKYTAPAFKWCYVT